ncbi:MAG: adenosylcobinamide-phosphate synthase CbiB [Tannerella sp.]|nr:adenosylcobinamide-phosphate synthase CbiB [Tannerella sp.]
MDGFLYFPVPLCVGWLLDKLLGDPPWLPHPVAGFGKLISFGERRLNRGNRRFVKGGIMSVVLIAGTFAVTSVLLSALCCETVQSGATHTGGDTNAIAFWASVAVASVFVFYCLAGKTLISEVREVFRACDRSLDEGRRQVARIVGRDTSRLSAQEVRTAALETLAENMSDGVVAPLFWYMLLGVPGMMAYKMVNTLDSMIGYRNERYRAFGCVAARIDDAANYIPARLTALFMILVSGRWPLFAFVKKYGPRHISPNSGYPEAALAGILNCRFGGSHDYFGKTVNKPFIGTNPKLLTGEDLNRSIKNARRTELLALAVCIALLGFFHCF